MKIVQLLDAFLIAALVAYLITPFVKILAIKLNYLDHPKDNKVHAHPTPLLGGVVIFIAFLISVTTKIQTISITTIEAILLGSVILLVIGLIDDRMGMMPKIKLLGQFLAAMVVIKAGLRMSFIDNYYLSVIVTYIWIIGITNSFNLLDNMNGLSAGIAAIAAFFFGVIMYINGQAALAAISFALAGSAAGFLKYNFPKAEIFMGDTGSLILGFVLSCLAILSNWNSSFFTNRTFIPILVLGYPIFDTSLVTVMRLLERRSIFDGGKDHSSHRLALLGLKRFGAVLVIYAICILLGMAALVISEVKFMPALIICILSFFAMSVLGIRLSFVDSKRFGRKKTLNGK